MSATPPPQLLRGPRRSARRQQHLQTAQEKKTSVTVSDNDGARSSTALTDHKSPNKDVASRARRKSQPKKGLDYPNPAQSTQPDKQNTSNIGQERPNGTPAKQAYAASTFLNSPAPSALPIPSFYSKSVPNVSTIKPPDVANDSGEAIQPGDSDDVKITGNVEPHHRESTPLDFLFDAARKARGTPRAESPIIRSNRVSVYGESPFSGSPAPREVGGMFPFELDDNCSREDETRPAFATPFRARIEAVRSSTTSDQSLTVEERDRKAKTEALKQLLMNAHHMQSESTAAQIPDPHNPLNARALPSQNSMSTQHHNRHRSRPSSSYSGLDHTNAEPSTPSFQNMATFTTNDQGNSQFVQRPQSSQLRHLYQRKGSEEVPHSASSSSTAPQLVSTANKYNLRRQTPKQGEGNKGARIDSHSPQQRPSAQQLEEDLKRFLKLDLTSKG